VTTACNEAVTPSAPVEQPIAAVALNENAQVVVEDPAVTDTASSIIITPPAARGSYGDVLVNEFVSDPISGSEEWVELLNHTDQTLSLAGWYIKEGSQKRTNLEGVLPPYGYHVVMSPNGSLNNSGDLIQLFDSYDTLIDEIAYGSFEVNGVTIVPIANDPDSVGNTQIGWSVLTPTPGLPNPNAQPQDSTVLSVLEISPTTFSVSSEDNDYDVSSNNSASTGSTNADGSTANTVDEQADSSVSATVAEETGDPVDTASTPLVTLANIRDLALNSALITEGVVSVAPGILGKQFFYLAGSGVQVYLYSGAFPQLSRGMLVRVKGVLTQSNGEARLKASSTEDITILSQGDAPTPHDVALSSIGEETEGWLVRVTGVVSERDSNAYQLTDETGSARVDVKDTTGIIVPFSVGDDVTIVGIVSQTKSGYRILPRDQQDILVRTPQVETQDDEAEPLPVPAGIITDRHNPTRTVAWSLALATLFTIVG
ncbi:lamin tail domain-containing protein, partial [Candidatus Uhrbacteria bacterium]|nr:lamin tail domain-containing protein [Candidatus Uhrbacteria bacterium]